MEHYYCTCIDCGKGISDPEFISNGGLCNECEGKRMEKLHQERVGMDMKKYHLKPAGSRWDFMDGDKKLFSVNNPAELFGGCKAYDDVYWVLNDLVNSEAESYFGGLPTAFTGSPDMLPPTAVEIMARTLCDAYLLTSGV